MPANEPPLPGEVLRRGVAALGSTFERPARSGHTQEFGTRIDDVDRVKQFMFNVGMELEQMLPGNSQQKRDALQKVIEAMSLAVGHLKCDGCQD